MADEKDIKESLEKLHDSLIDFQEILEKRRFGPRGYQSPTRQGGRSSRKKFSQKKFVSGERRLDRQRPIPRQSEQEQRSKEKDQRLAEMKRKLNIKKSEEVVKVDKNGQWQIEKANHEKGVAIADTGAWGSKKGGVSTTGTKVALANAMGGHGNDPELKARLYNEAKKDVKTRIQEQPKPKLDKVDLGKDEVKKYGDMCVAGGSGKTAMGAVGAANKSEK